MTIFRGENRLLPCGTNLDLYFLNYSNLIHLLLSMGYGGSQLSQGNGCYGIEDRRATVSVQKALDTTFPFVKQILFAAYLWSSAFSLSCVPPVKLRAGWIRPPEKHLNCSGPRIKTGASHVIIRQLNQMNQGYFSHHTVCKPGTTEDGSQRTWFSTLK